MIYFKLSLFLHDFQEFVLNDMKHFRKKVNCSVWAEFLADEAGIITTKKQGGNAYERLFAGQGAAIEIE